MDRVYIVMPAYNEQDNIRELIETWYPVVEKTGSESRLVIVNDGSRDATYDIMRQCAADKPQFIPLTKENGGHGDTVLFAYHYALSAKCDKTLNGGVICLFSRRTRTDKPFPMSFGNSGSCAMTTTLS